MTNITFEFNRTKAIESILYLATKITDSDIYGICKLLYLVDKTSLEKYGRFIFGETYCALEQGATPSNAYDLLKEVKEVIESPSRELRIEGNKVIALRNPNLEYLSESDIECLNQIINLYGNVPNWIRRRDAHDAAWERAWNKRGNKKSVRMPVESIAESLADSDTLLDYLLNRDAE
jgi:uncharacterized phage-associated protein